MKENFPNVLFLKFILTLRQTNQFVLFILQKMIGTRVYVGGLSYRVSERDIDKFFKGFSGVGDIVIKNGFAFVVRKFFLYK